MRFLVMCEMSSFDDGTLRGLLIEQYASSIPASETESIFIEMGYRARTIPRGILG